MDPHCMYGNYPGLKPEAQQQAQRSRSSSSSESEREFSKTVRDLPKADKARTPLTPDKQVKFDKLSDLPIGYDLLAQKWTIDLPKSTSFALADALGHTICGRAWSGNLRRVKVSEKGSHYQIRFLSGLDLTELKEFIGRLVKQCELLGIRDKPRLRSFSALAPTSLRRWAPAALRWKKRWKTGRPFPHGN